MAVHNEYTSGIYTKLCIAIVAGVASHLAVFIRVECHTKAPMLLKSYIFISFCFFAFQRSYETRSSSQVLQDTSFLVTVYAATIFTSMAIYRAFFHRLRGFPGPLLARFSKLWHVAHVLDSKNYLFLSRMQHNYGDFVRTGL